MFVKAIYLDMKHYEMLFTSKREELEGAMLKIKEYRDMLKKRKDAYDKVRELKDEELILLRALESNRLRGENSGPEKTVQNEK